MMTTTHPLADDYLRRLERAAKVLPRRERDDLVAEIRSHLDSGLGPEATEADVRNLIDDLGTPESIVAAAEPVRAVVRRGPREIFALALLVLGLPPLIGWLAGAGLLLWSPLWSVRQKLLGILVWPGGYPTVAAFGGLGVASQSCPVPGSGVAGPTPAGGPGLPPGCVETAASPWGIVLLVVLVVAPLLVAAYLFRAAGKAGAGA